MRNATLVLALLILTALPARADNWGPWGKLLGSWKAQGTGQPGASVADVKYTEELDGHLIVRHNRNTYGNGQIHEDLLLVRQTPQMLRYEADYYDNEGHYIHYDCVAFGDRVTCTSPEGARPRFRLTIKPHGRDRFVTRFEIAAPGQPFKLYVEGEARRSEK